MSEIEMSLAKTMIDTTGTQLLRDDSNRVDELDPAILEEFKSLDEKAKMPSVDRENYSKQQYDFSEEEETRYLQLIDMVAQKQVERCGAMNQEKKNLYRTNMEESHLMQHESAQDFIKD